MINEGVCLNCQGSFIVKTEGQEFCSPRCGEEYIKKKKFLGRRQSRVKRSKVESGVQARMDEY